MCISHSYGNLLSRRLILQLGQQTEGEGEGSSRTLAGGHVAIDGAELTRIGGTFECLLKAGIAGGTLAAQDAQSAQYQRSRTDGSHAFAGSVLLEQGLAHTLMIVQVRSPRHAARQHQQVGIAEVAVGKLLVGLNAHTMSCFNNLRVLDYTHGNYFNTSATQHVDGNQCFDILEAVGQENINFCHNRIVVLYLVISVVSHHVLSGDDSVAKIQKKSKIKAESSSISLFLCNFATKNCIFIKLVMTLLRPSLLQQLNPDTKYSAMQIFRWLWKVWKGNRLQATLNACIGLTGVGFSLTMVWAMKRAIDTATGAREGSIYSAVAVMAVITLCEFAVGISRVWVKNILGVRARNRMQQLTLARLLRSEWRGREAMHSGDVINRLETDVNKVVNFLTETLPSTLSTIALFIGAFVYLSQMDGWLAVVTVSILPVFILLSRFYVAKMRQLNRKVRESDSFIQSLLTDTMHQRMLIKTMEADGQMLDRLEDSQSELRSRVKKRTAFSVVSHLFLNTGFSLGYFVAFLWGLVRLHDGTITFGAMTAFLQLVYRIQGPARDLTRLAPAFVSVFTSAERLMELEEIPEEQQGENVLMEAPCGVRFTDVSYRYTPTQCPTVVHANYDFTPGSCTAILGETGAGKTTLIRLLLALIRPQEGEITIYSGKLRVESGEFATAIGESCGAVANSPLSTLHSPLSPLHRCNFVYVPQGNTLLSGTLRDNLKIGAPDATDEQMYEALRRACADFVSELPDGLDTRFAEQGGGLSEGQAQRIAIARALLRPGSIILLDEATSALDAETERQLLDNILRDKRKTVIFVTHRQAVVDYCDRVIRIG